MNGWMYQEGNWTDYAYKETSLASRLLALPHGISHSSADTVPVSASASVPVSISASVPVSASASVPVSASDSVPVSASASVPVSASDSVSVHRPFTICAVGAGGKTSLILELMREYLAMGKSVLVTTTTHMFLPKAPSVSDKLAFPEASAISDQLAFPESPAISDQLAFPKSPAISDQLVFLKPPAAPDQLTFLGTPVTPELHRDGWIKCQAPPSEELDAISAQKDIVLIEADGSRRLPLKVPGDHEPVVPERTDLILAVYGLTALGKTISETCQRYELLEQAHTQLPFPVPKSHETVTPVLIARMMRHFYLEPLQKKYPEASVIPVWNQADTPELVNTARDIARECGWNTQFITAFEK